MMWKGNKIIMTQFPHQETGSIAHGAWHRQAGRQAHHVCDCARVAVQAAAKVALGVGG